MELKNNNIIFQELKQPRDKQRVPVVKRLARKLAYSVDYQLWYWFRYFHFSLDHNGSNQNKNIRSFGMRKRELKSWKNRKRLNVEFEDNVIRMSKIHHVSYSVF